MLYTVSLHTWGAWPDYHSYIDMEGKVKGQEPSVTLHIIHCHVTDDACPASSGHNLLALRMAPEFCGQLWLHLCGRLVCHAWKMLTFGV